MHMLDCSLLTSFLVYDEKKRTREETLPYFRRKQGILEIQNVNIYSAKKFQAALIFPIVESYAPGA